MHSWCVVLSTLFFITTCSSQTDQNYWKSLAEKELEEALQVRFNLRTAKNVILFVGDGMGPNTVTAARIYRGGESHRLAFEKFPHVGLLKTYSANKMVPDSACSATALFSGIKANLGTLGVDATVPQYDCEASLNKEAWLDSLAAYALKAGKSSGLVTTMRVTHATPAPLYAHSASRSWECEANMPANAKQCKDIARQLVEDWPGRDLHVVLGGGRQVLVSNSTGTPEDPISAWSCYRQDGRDLIDEYRRDKEDRNLKYQIVSNTRELLNIENDIDYLFGIFANEHLQYEFERNKSPEGQPSISDMTKAAIQVLSKNPKGYFLMVEGGKIDMAHHRGRAKTAVDETVAMERAVQLAVDMTSDEDTLIIVTSDHTHTLSINGYPDRGASIFGIAAESPFDHKNYTTLSYGTGGPGSFQYDIKTIGNKTRAERREPSKEDTESYHYEQIAAIPLDENSHGGGDVAVYAKGPHSHLFHSVHEQHYVFQAIAYAAKIGPYSNGYTTKVNILLLTTALLLIIKLF
ncbi:PREDICTED: alkaline phosphatase isoform X2 [Papilio xuthus]|uniref:Alkaline phosphatase n=1 Tax=Papilio xuthus TaxID=66420 RepID=A0AAJ6YZJ8_PAPXU|nr:PREDICTED: alkaline phosphatase isoform X2 [Papilio xuthus]